VADAAVYGVSVPGTEGRAGMAAVVATPDFDLGELRRALVARLPDYARPLFIRIVDAIELTGTFKLRKQALARAGYDPASTSDALYVDDAAQGQYLPLDEALHQRLQAGQLRF
jgi:fatty-acyl-CoA synthase